MFPVNVENLSLDRLLQKALYIAIQTGQQPALQAVQSPIDQRIAERQAFERFCPLLPNRHSYGIEYISGLPLKLAAIVPSISAEVLAAAIADQFSHADPLKNPSEGIDIAALQHHLEVQCLASGQLLIRPDATVLNQWLWSLITLAPTWQHNWPICRTAIAAPDSIPINAPMAERLRLSPLAFVQYLHARCSQLLAQGDPVDQLALADADTRVAVLPGSLRPFEHLDDLEIRVVKNFVRLMDQLVDEQVSAQALLKPGYQLAATTYDWLQAQGQALNLSTDQKIVLKAVQVALACLLLNGLNCPAPLSF